METFKKEIRFISQVVTQDEEETIPSFKSKEITKLVTFLDLVRTDKAHHKLHFAIIDAVGKFFPKSEDAEELKEGERVTLEIVPDTLYDITSKFIKNMVQLEPGSNEFTEQDLKEFLLDSGAIWVFGMWLLTEKLLPFFTNFRPTTPV